MRNSCCVRVETEPEEQRRVDTHSKARTVKVRCGYNGATRAYESIVPTAVPDFSDGARPTCVGVFKHTVHVGTCLATDLAISALIIIFNNKLRANIFMIRL